MAATRTWHLIAYDVHDSQRLRLVAKKLEAYGNRVQYSIFRCRLDPKALEKLRWELAEIMDAEDSLLVMPICRQCASRIPIHSTGDQTDWADDPPSFQII